MVRWLSILPMLVHASLSCSLENDVLCVQFDTASAQLSSLSRVGGQKQHSIDGDSPFEIAIGDLPFPSDTNCSEKASIPCPIIEGFQSSSAVTTTDQCAFRCMTADDCLGFTAIRQNVTWGRNRIWCQLHSCAPTSAKTSDVSATGDISCAGTKPKVPATTKLSPSSCEAPVTSSGGATSHSFIYKCGAFRTNVTYELQQGWHFVAKRVSVCKLSSSHNMITDEATACDPAAGFTIHKVIMWNMTLPGLEVGAVATNVFGRGRDQMTGDNQVATFYRPSGSSFSDSGKDKAGDDGVFMSVQSPYYFSDLLYGVLHWKPGRWEYINGGSWLLGASIDRIKYPAGSLTLTQKTAVGGEDLALLQGESFSLPSAVSASATASVLMEQGIQFDSPPNKPVKKGFSGLFFGNSANTDIDTPTTISGVAAVVSQADPPTVELLSFTNYTAGSSAKPLILASEKLATTGSFSQQPVLLDVKVECLSADSNVKVSGCDKHAWSILVNGKVALTYHAPNLQADAFDIRTGYACDEPGQNHYKFIDSVATVKACEALCSVDKQCLEFEYAASLADGHRWCQLFNGTSQPNPNADYTCGCRGHCSSDPSPSPTPTPPSPSTPTPAPGPAPPMPPLPDAFRVGLLVLQQDSSFLELSLDLPKPAATNTDTHRRDSSAGEGKGVVARGWYQPLFTQDPRLGAVHEADAGVLGLTELTGYELPESGVDLGERSAMARCVEPFLLDKAMRSADGKGGGGPGKALRYLVAWDSNDYQLDMARAEDRAEYKRIIDRASELGIGTSVFEPRDTAVASRWNHTDAWWWEEALWFNLGISIRDGKWDPSHDAVPATTREMMDYFKAKGVKPASYTYPTLAYRSYNKEREGSDQLTEDEKEWLFESPQREAGDGNRASLASPALQNHLIDVMTRFLAVTGGGGFAWDYGILGDTRTPNEYAETRGWLRVLEGLRKNMTDIVMDHRQTAHVFGPWYNLAGSYCEPIAGDENPESYGASLASLSTDHVLADNLRLTNYRYRGLQLLPNDRIPGFMFHQIERHFNNGTGSDNGRPGDKINSQGQPLWKPDLYPDADGNYSGITYSNCVLDDASWHRRDFDYLGYRYSVLSTVGTAGRNLVAANLPSRDMQEFQKFPAADVEWIKKWFDFADTNAKYLIRTQPLFGYEYPRLGLLDGAASIIPSPSSSDGASGEGYIFLYNPSPLPVGQTQRITFDQSIGLGCNASANASASASASCVWVVREVYPREEGVPLGVWAWGEAASFVVAGTGARVLFLKPSSSSLAGVAPASNVLSFNLSCTSANADSKGTVTVVGASGLTGSKQSVVLRVDSSTPPKNLMVNGQSVPSKSVECGNLGHVDSATTCLSAELSFGGAPLYRSMSAVTKESPVPSAVTGGLYNATLAVPSGAFAQLQQRQTRYNISWEPQDLDASWLAPSRLLLYIYIARPTPSLATPNVTIGGQAVDVLRAYNSRGNHAQVSAGGGAASGNTAKTFLGFYIDCSFLKGKQGALEIAVNFPTLAEPGEKEAGRFFGLFWATLGDEYTNQILAN